MSATITLDDLGEVVSSVAAELGGRLETLETTWDDTNENTLWAVYYHDPENDPQGGDVLCDDLERWRGLPRSYLPQVRMLIVERLTLERQRIVSKAEEPPAASRYERLLGPELV